MKPRRLFVAGANGQLAQALSEAAQPNWIVTCAGRSTADLTRPAALRSAIAEAVPDLVINAAAYTAVDKAEDDEAMAFAVNARGAGHLAEAAARAGAALIHVSTDYVFDGEKPAPYLETDAPNPLGVYGRSKRAGEQAVAAAHPRAIILRTAWVYSHTGANFLKTMLRLASTQDAVRVVDDQRGQPTLAADLAAAALRIGADPHTPGIYHATGASAVTWHGFAAAIFAEAARRGMKTPQLTAITTKDYPLRARRPQNSVLDGTRLNTLFGIALPGFENALPRCFDRL